MNFKSKVLLHSAYQKLVKKRQLLPKKKSRREKKRRHFPTIFLVKWHNPISYYYNKQIYPSSSPYATASAKMNALNHCFVLLFWRQADCYRTSSMTFLNHGCVCWAVTTMTNSLLWDKQHDILESWLCLLCSDNNDNLVTVGQAAWHCWTMAVFAVQRQQWQSHYCGSSSMTLLNHGCVCCAATTVTISLLLAAWHCMTLTLYDIVSSGMTLLNHGCVCCRQTDISDNLSTAGQAVWHCWSMAVFAVDRLTKCRSRSRMFLKCSCLCWWQIMNLVKNCCWMQEFEIILSALCLLTAGFKPERKLLRDVGLRFFNTRDWTWKRTAVSLGNMTSMNHHCIYLRHVLNPGGNCCRIQEYDIS